MLVEAQSLRGFVPVSHLLTIQPDTEENERTNKLGEMVGENMCLKVIEYDPDRGRLVFSERAAQAGPGRRVELLDSLVPQTCVSGEVTNITRFGVFVDLGGVEGLIHVSEMRIRDDMTKPADIVTEGQRVQVKVLHVDAEKQRLGLSLISDPDFSYE